MAQPYETIFVGREEELTQLMTFVQDAFAGKAGVAFVTGEAGIGKTYLVEELFRRLRNEYDDVVVASGQCTIQSASYLPLRSVLEDLLTNHQDLVAEIIRKVGLELLGVFGISGRLLSNATDGSTARLLQQQDEFKQQWDLLSQQLSRLEEERILETRPEEKFRLEHKIEKIRAERTRIADTLNALERQRVPQAGVDVPEKTIPQDLTAMQVFGWYTKVMQDVSLHIPLVLFLDDLHWADDSSLNLLLHLGRETENQRMLVIGTYRPHEVAPISLLMQVKATLGRYGAREFSLDVSEDKAEDVDKTQHFVHDYLMAKYSTNFSDQFERVLVDRTEANALFLTEILKNLEEKGQITKSDNVYSINTTLSFGDLPEKVENAISERVNRLEETLREILDYASVEGDDFIAQVIAKVRELQERSLINDLTKKLMKTYHLILERGGKSLPNGSRIHEFSFKHNLIREYIYAQLSETDKEFIHAEIGECLEKLYEPNTDEIASQLAIHFYRGHVLKKDVYYCLKAAQDANRRYDASEAVRFAKMGMEALETWTKALSQQEYAEYKVQFFLELARTEEFGGDPKEEKDHIQVGISYLENNLSLVDAIPDTLRAEIYYQLGRLYDRKGSPKQKAKDYLEEALGIYVHCIEKENKAETLYLLKKNKAEVLYRLGYIYPYFTEDQNSDDKSIEIVKESLSIAQKICARGLEVKCLSWLAWRLSGKNLSYAEKCAAKALNLLQIHNKTDYYITIRVFNAWARVCRGTTKYKEGIQYWEKSYKLARQIEDKFSEVLILTYLGDYYSYYVNSQERSQKVLEECLIIVEQSGIRRDITLDIFGWVLARQGKWREAEQRLQNAPLEESDELSKSYYTYRIGLLYMLQGKNDQAKSKIEYRLRILKEYKKALDLEHCGNIARYYALSGNKTLCKKYIADAQPFLKQKVSVHKVAACLYEIAEAHRLIGEFESAKTACQQSLDNYLSHADAPEELIYVAEARLVMGKILVDIGDYQEAITYLNKAKAAFEICGHYALGETQLYLGKAHLGLGGVVFQRQAKEYVNQALAEFQRLELQHKEQEARAVLQQLTTP